MVVGGTERTKGDDVKWLWHRHRYISMYDMETLRPIHVCRCGKVRA